MLDFFASFLTYPQRNALFHYPLQQMWANIQPRRYEYIQDPLYRLRYLLTTDYSRHEPDDALLRQVMEKLFRERRTPLGAGVIEYLLVRMERSIDHARELTAWLDRAALAQKKPVTRALAREGLAALSNEAAPR